MAKKRIVFMLLTIMTCIVLSGCGSKKKDEQTFELQKIDEKPFSFSDVTWDTKRDEIVNVVGKKPDREEETEAGGYSYYFVGDQFEGYKVETNYVYENDLLSYVILVFRDVTESDYNKLENTFNDKYGKFSEENTSKIWNAGSYDVILDNAPIGFGMLKVGFEKH